VIQFGLGSVLLRGSRLSVVPIVVTSALIDGILLDDGRDPGWHPPELRPRCSACINLPGWFRDPKLRAAIDPDPVGPRRMAERSGWARAAARTALRRPTANRRRGRGVKNLILWQKTACRCGPLDLFLMAA
jgi:hypothetical protein